MKALVEFRRHTRSLEFHLREGCDHVEISPEHFKMAASAVDLLVLLGAALLAVERALGLAHEIKLLLALRDESPVGIVGANRRVNFEPGRQLDE